MHIFFSKVNFVTYIKLQQKLRFLVVFSGELPDLPEVSGGRVGGANCIIRFEIESKLLDEEIRNHTGDTYCPSPAPVHL